MPSLVKRKIGPLPVWGWGAIGVGGVLALRYFNSRGIGATDTTGNMGDLASQDTQASDGGSLQTGGGGGTYIYRYPTVIKKYYTGKKKKPHGN